MTPMTVPTGKRLKLRQIALVAEKLGPVESAITDVFGVEVCYRDPGVAHFGLENALFPIGDQFLEVVAPTQPNTAGGRYLERRGGDGGYMVITQCDDHAVRRARVAELEVRIAHQFRTEQFLNMQLHPKDTGGTFFEIDQQLGASCAADNEAWEPAGPGWLPHQKLDRVLGIGAAEIQCDEPEDIASRWSRIAERTLTRLDDDTGHAFELDNAQVRFVACEDGRPEGLGGIDLICSDIDAILQAAHSHNDVGVANNVLTLAGLRLRLTAAQSG